LTLPQLLDTTLLRGSESGKWTGFRFIELLGLPFQVSAVHSSRMLSSLGAPIARYRHITEGSAAGK